MALKAINQLSTITKQTIKKTIKISQTTSLKAMAALGNIHNIRVIRFLLVVSIATLTIFLYASYSSNGPLTPPPPQPHALLRALPPVSQNKSADAASVSGGDTNSLDNNHPDSAAPPQPDNEASLLKLNRKAAASSETSAGSGGGGAGGAAAGAAKSPAAAKKQHQHREPTIDVDAVNEETADEEFGNDLLEDAEAQNIDNALVVGSINNSNTSSAQQNNGGAPQEQSKSQAQLDQQKKANEKSVDKILDTDVMIPTTNLQKFIENADKILKNITTTNDNSSKLLSRTKVDVAKESKDNKEQEKSEGKDTAGDVDADTNNDAARPPSVVMTIKRPGGQPQEPPQQKPQEAPTESHDVVVKPKTPIVNPPTPNNQSNHTKGIPLKECYETGHLNEEINFAKVCPKNGEELKLLILISSAPTHGEARLAIRQTWAHYGTRRDVSIGFVLGRTENQTIHKELSIENFIYGDMIRGNFIDSYSNLTLKTISTLEWVDAHCRQAKFILKTDDDMFINVPKLLQFIDGHAKQKRTIYGRLAKQWKPIRNKKSKYYVSTEQFSQPIFPAFTTGPAYLLTSDCTHSLYERALQQVFLKLEDVFTTGIVAQQLGIKRVHANEFLNRRIAFNPCNIRKLISVHMIKSNEQFDLWKKLLDKSTKCK